MQSECICYSVVVVVGKMNFCMQSYGICGILLVFLNFLLTGHKSVFVGDECTDMELFYNSEVCDIYQFDYLDFRSIDEQPLIN